MMRRGLSVTAGVLTLFTAASTALAEATLSVVKARGELACGVANDLPGFSAPDASGRWSGLDVDVCRAVAAAVLGDATKVRWIPLNAQARLTALQTGEIDLLTRNTTYTLTRDTAAGLNFTVINFFDGQGFLVPKRLKVEHAAELSGATVCLQTGTTSELNLADFARKTGMELPPVTLEKYEEMIAAYLAGRCDALSADGSALAIIRAFATPRPDEHLILPERISKEPLAPAVRQGDDQWLDIVRWAQFVMIEAEERDIASTNVDSQLSGEDPMIRRLLGFAGDARASFGIDDGWGYRIIRQVGNYGESFDRNLGAGSKLNIPRGLNELWTRGGLMYAMPPR